MPVHVVKRGSRYCTVERSGKVHGCSDTKAQAQSSARAINASAHGWRPTRRRRGSRHVG